MDLSRNELTEVIREFMRDRWADGEVVIMNHREPPPEQGLPEDLADAILLKEVKKWRSL